MGGQVFACAGAVQTGISVKTGRFETAQMLIDAGARFADLVGDTRNGDPKEE